MLIPAASVNAPPHPKIFWYFISGLSVIIFAERILSFNFWKLPSILSNRFPALFDVNIRYELSGTFLIWGNVSQYVPLQTHTILPGLNSLWEHGVQKQRFPPEIYLFTFNIKLKFLILFYKYLHKKSNKITCTNIFFVSIILDYSYLTALKRNGTVTVNFSLFI